jgi:hypothetical protein
MLLEAQEDYFHDLEPAALFSQCAIMSGVRCRSNKLKREGFKTVSAKSEDSKVVSQREGYEKKHGFQSGCKKRGGVSDVREPAVFNHEVQPVRHHIDGEAAIPPSESSVGFTVTSRWSEGSRECREKARLLLATGECFYKPERYCFGETNGCLLRHKRMTWPVQIEYNFVLLIVDTIFDNLKPSS